MVSDSPVHFVFFGSANACAMPSAIDFTSLPEMFVITATTMPRSGNVRNDVEPPSNVRLA